MKVQRIIQLILGFIIISSFIQIYYINSREEVVPPKNEFAFATLATPAFAMGAVALGYSIKKYHQDKYDLICLVTPDVNSTWREILSQWWIVKPVNEYRPFTHFRRSWTKLKVWNFIEYKKIIYLDTDLLLFSPVDELFTYPELSCVPDLNPPQICNTGVLVLEPRKGVFEGIDRLARIDEIRKGIGDQSTINAYFKKFTPLPAIYNLPRAANFGGFGKIVKLGRHKIVHYVCKKPWKCGREEISTCGCGYPSFNQKWWDTFDEACNGKKCIETWVEEKVKYDAPNKEELDKHYID